jgi:carbon monoxide dehydrogenase subunit G
MQVVWVDCFSPKAKSFPGGFLVLKIVALVVFAIIVIVLGLAATKPDSFEVERSATIQAAPEKVKGLIDDFHQWGAWSPWEKLDPGMKKTFSGTVSGKGSVYEWEGNSKVGQGRMEILDVTPEKVTIKLDFIKPFEGHNVAEFVVQPQGVGSRVNWTMRGPMPFVSKLMSVFASMDKLIGGDFERGLANMKAAAESGK